MKIMKILATVAVLAGLSVPVQAQRALPVQVVCIKGTGDPYHTYYKPICGAVKKAVNKSSEYKQAKKGNRYVLILDAWSGEVASGDVIMSITVGAKISDPLSKMFPYLVASIPHSFMPSELSVTAAAIVNGALPVATDFFSDYVDEINSFAYLQQEFGEDIHDDIATKMKLAMEEFEKQNTNR
jgi:hypothetical protein